MRALRWPVPTVDQCLDDLEPDPGLTFLAGLTFLDRERIDYARPDTSPQWGI